MKISFGKSKNEDVIKGSSVKSEDSVDLSMVTKVNPRLSKLNSFRGSSYLLRNGSVSSKQMEKSGLNDYYTLPLWGKKVSKSKTKKIVRNFLIGSAFIVLFSVLGALGGLIYIINAYSQDLPNLDKYLAIKSVEGKESIIVDRNGVELYRIRGDAIKEKVNIDEVPPYLKWAFIAAEDAEFYEHTGLNTTGLMRAIICHATDRAGIRNCGGGSSITQQLIKNATDEKSRTFERKVREAVLAREIEQKLTKDEILEFYMNVVPEGGVLYGVKSGAKYMFGKENLNDLTLPEMAYLAGIPNLPSVFSPWGGDRYIPESGQKRAIYVLERMRDIKDKIGITDYEIDEAVKIVKESKVVFKADVVNKKAPHFVDFVMRELNDIYKEYETETEDGARAYLKDKGYIITSSVDLDSQELLEGHLRETVVGEEFQKVVGAQNASGVVMDPKNGDILALVGSRDYRATSDDQRFAPVFNAALSPRSMGSSMKPALYLTYFMQGGHQYSRLFDIGGINMELDPSAPAYFPQNYSRSFGQFGNLPTVFTSLQYSLNVPAVATYNVVGKDNYIDTYKKLNNWSPIAEQIKGAAAPLGAANMPLIEQTHAYATMAAEGIYRPIRSIIKIEDKQGKLVFDNTKDKGRQVIDSKYMYMINELNQNYWLFNADDVLLDIKKTTDIGGKTGTSDNTQGKPGDNVFISYTPDVVIGMWAGNSCGIDECPLTGSNATGEGLYNSMYKSFLTKYRDKIPQSRFSTNVPGVVEADVCPETGMIHSKLCPSPPIRVRMADTSFKANENESMYQSYKVAICDGVEKRVDDKDIYRVEGVEEKIYFNYIYPYESIQNGVNRVVGQKPPEDFCPILESQENTDPITSTKPEIKLVSPSGNNTIIKAPLGKNLNLSVEKIGSAEIDRVEVVYKNLILSSEAGDNQIYSFTLNIESNTFSVGNTTLDIIAYSRKGDEYILKVPLNITDKPIVTPTPTPTPTSTPTVIITIPPTITPTP